MRAVAYLRVSTVAQIDGFSLNAQERLFRELCRNRGWEQVRTYREEGRSAHVEAIAKRPVFKRLLDDVSKNEFDVVVVHTLDRWSRNLRVTLESLRTLAQHNVGFVSISEGMDHSTAQGRLSIQLIGAFAEYFSESLGTHIRKGQSERALQGKHLGGLPFGYESCWTREKGNRSLWCDPEHSGGVHLVEGETGAVRKLFRRYATGTATLGHLTAWMNGQGFRTRNTKALPDATGELVAGPRYFTTASVRSILHNAFYAGLIKHSGELLPGTHEGLISKDLFDRVQDAMRRNSGGSRTLSSRPVREYLLKGLIRCVYCGMPMWAQTYKNGQQYYREHRESRSLGSCPAQGGSIPCHVADEQVRRIVESIVLPEDWLDQALARLQLTSEVERVRTRRDEVQSRLRRLGQAFIDGVVPEGDYRYQRRTLELELESLVVPEVDAVKEAGELLSDLPRLWTGATLEERRKLLLTMLDAVYVDTKTNTLVEVRVKGAFGVILPGAGAEQWSPISVPGPRPHLPVP